MMRKQTEELSERLKKENIDLYVISDTDDHQSEYTGRHYHALEEFSGFTGGDGKMVISSDKKALLWTDGRYFTQAEGELKNSGIELMRMGEPGVPSLTEWIKKNLPSGGTIGFDGKCVSYKLGKALCDAADNVISEDICGLLWKNRPAETCTRCRLLGEERTGKSSAEKLSELRKKLRDTGADAHIMSSLDDIAWLLNMRADDIPYNPVFSSFMIITENEARLYIDEKHFAPYSGGSENNADNRPSEEIKEKELPGKPADREYLESIGVKIYPYNAVYEDAEKLGGRILIDTARCSFELVRKAAENAVIIDQMSPVTAEKCRKNKTEAENLRTAQHNDSTALTKFMYMFKKRLGLENIFGIDELNGYAQEKYGRSSDSFITEWDCVEELHKLRSMQEGFIEESFSTISAYGENAAMAHYAPSPDRRVNIEPKGLYLVDSGGQYVYGTTDVTRTWSCGPLTEEESTCFTLTVIANLRLSDEKFIEGTSGLTADGAARDVFWRRGLNYNHGTGHGVGFCLNVHEAPVGIRYRAASLEGAYPLLEGMYVSDEPGMYKAGSFGIRTENLLLVKHDYTNEYGRFMSFEIMNYCPIDKSCLNLSIMEERDKKLLNAYHRKVYEELNSDMNEEERIWLEKMCSPID